MYNIISFLYNWIISEISLSIVIRKQCLSKTFQNTLWWALERVGNWCRLMDSEEWGDRCSGGGSASDQESGGKGRQLATSALKRPLR